ncbi:hypothetical protein LH496_28085, partial [Klebsiella pneumoniae]|nr:hypothetical protein [Klebsiella pneumoniae]
MTTHFARQIASQISQFEALGLGSTGATACLEASGHPSGRQRSTPSRLPFAGLPVQIPLRSTLGNPAEEDTYMPHSYRKMESPVGTLTLVARDDAFLVAILWQH